MVKLQFSQLLLIIKTIIKLHLTVGNVTLEINNVITPVFILMIKGLLWGYHFYQEAHCCWFNISFTAIRKCKSGLILVPITKKCGKGKRFKGAETT